MKKLSVIDPYREVPSELTICAECSHMLQKDDFWLCQSPYTIERHEGRNLVTGKLVPAKYKWTDCSDKNTDGNCPEYEPKPPRLSLWQRILTWFRNIM